MEGRGVGGGARQNEHPAEEVIREARRRKVFRMAIAYPAAVFAALEGAASFFPVWGAPEWAFRALMGCAVLGFPLAMVLTWDYDITSRGIVRTPDEPSDADLPRPPRWRVGLFVAVMIALGWIFGSLR